MHHRDRHDGFVPMTTPTPEKPIEDAILALAKKNRGFYGKPFFHWAGCELEHGFADELADELSQQGYEVFVVDEYTVSWEPPPDEIHIGSRPPLETPTE